MAEIPVYAILAVVPIAVAGLCYYLFVLHRQTVKTDEEAFRRALVHELRTV